MQTDRQPDLLGPALPPGEVHVWTADVAGEPRRLDVLSGDERVHAGHFRFDEDRRRWVTSRVLLRLVLGRYLATDPSRVELATVARGRPVVRRPDQSDWLSFSQARSGEFCVVAVARGTRVGVDVERVASEHDVVAIARRALGVEMAGRLATLPDERRLDAFYRAWVAEEARGKCRGTGLLEPDDAARALPLFVSELRLKDGYAAGLATDAPPGVVRVCTAEA